MFSPDDTIVAIATPPGRGGIGVVRVSGPRASEVARTLLGDIQPLAPRLATFAKVRAAGKSGASAIDQVIVTYFPAPHSYTGEDVVELSAHGSPPILNQIVQASIEAGARLAQPGEFTFRAYLRGRIDLVQAEAVADLIEAVTPLQARAAFDQLEGGLTREIQEIHAALFDLSARLEASLDFPDEGYHFVESAAAQSELDALVDRLERLIADGRQGRLIREGAHVVIAGRANVGKSSVFNRLAGVDRAIVTEKPGTTRDMITESVALDGIQLTLVDTAGIRDTADAAEQQGVSRARQSLEVADLIILVLDRSCGLADEDRALLIETGRHNRVLALNKTDLPAVWDSHGLQAPTGSVVRMSALTGEGLPALRQAIVASLGRESPPRDTIAITNVRHLELLERAVLSLSRARRAATEGLPEELVLTDLQEARAVLEEVTGARTSEDVLAHIFQRFCIGK